MTTETRIEMRKDTELQGEIRSLLNYYIGKENPITAVEIGEKLGFGKLKNTYIIREAIGELIKHDYPVCSNGDGFFRAKDEAEAVYFAEPLRQRGVKIIVRRRDLIRGAHNFFNGAEQKQLL